MSKCLVVLDHSFRLNSLLMKIAFSSYDNISIVYPSNWYYNNKARKLYKESNCNLHKEAINYLSFKLKTKYNYDLFILKSKNPETDIENFCIENNVDHVLYDMPLFKEKLNFSENLNVLEIDSDSYIPDCNKMTAKSRWMFWDRNRLKKEQVFIKPKSFDFFNALGEKHSCDFKLANKTKQKIQKTLLQLKTKLKEYGKKRNSREGSTKLSPFLHHGIIDARELTQATLSLTSQNIGKENQYVPFLRQLAFREISIRKVRQNQISLFEDSKNLARLLLDKASQDNLKDVLFDASFTKEQLFNGNTGFEKLDNEINLCIQNRWMPNRARMWFAGECYWGLGGGLYSLEVLIEFFNKFSDDAQSPNNIISCVESMRLKYGKVMKFNKERTFKLLEDN